MAQGLITDTTLDSIADAIRAKHNSQATFTPKQFADAVSLIGWELPETHTFGGASDSDFVDIVKAARAGIIDLQTDCGWAVGDTRTISLPAISFPNAKSGSSSTSYGSTTLAAANYTLVLTSFAEYEGCGNVVQIDFKSSLALPRMFWTKDDTSSYPATRTHTTDMPLVANNMPTYIKNLMLPFTARTNSGTSSNVLTMPNTLMTLRSVREVLSSLPTHFQDGIGVYLPYYETNGAKNKSGTDQWWLRSHSTRKDTSGYYHMAYIDPNYPTMAYGAQPSNYTKGFCPFFCL